MGKFLLHGIIIELLDIFTTNLYKLPAADLGPYHHVIRFCICNNRSPFYLILFISFNPRFKPIIHCNVWLHNKFPVFQLIPRRCHLFFHFCYRISVYRISFTFLSVMWCPPSFVVLPALQASSWLLFPSPRIPHRDMAWSIGAFRASRLDLIYLMVILYYGHIDMSIDKLYELYGHIERNLCAIYLWTHILTYVIMSL